MVVSSLGPRYKRWAHSLKINSSSTTIRNINLRTVGRIWGQGPATLAAAAGTGPVALGVDAALNFPGPGW